MVSDDIKIRSLGTRLRDERLRRNESQTAFAARIGVSVPTLRKMETGDPTVQIGHWIMALEVLDRSRELDHLLAPSEDLFAKYEQVNAPRRRRASRRQR